MQQVIETDFATALQMALTALGVGFLVANGWILFQFIQYFRYRKTALVTWPTQKPPHYPFLLGLGLVFGILVVVKLVVQQRAPIEAFGEGMLLLYYGYLWPMTFRIGRGLYEDGIWTDSRFVPYSQIGGLSWREDPEITLVIIYRLRSLARRLWVPQRHYGEVRRRLLDKIATHDLHFTMKSFDLGGDEREVV